MIQLPITTETGEPRTGYVLDIFNPRAILCGDLPARVALLKAIFGIDEHGQLTKPPPPQAFATQVLWWVFFNRLPTPAPKPRKPRRPSISKMIAQAEKATGKPVTSITMPDGTKLGFDKSESAAPDNPWPLDEFRTKETKQ